MSFTSLQPALSANCRLLTCTALQPETDCVQDCEAFSSSELSAVFQSQTAFKVSMSNSSPFAACRQCPQPCCALQRSCFWAQLCLFCAAWFPSDPSIPGTQPRSAAEDQPKAEPSLPALGSFEVSLGLQFLCRGTDSSSKVRPTSALAHCERWKCSSLDMSIPVP